MIQREINFQQVLQTCLKSDLSFTQPLNKQNMGGDRGGQSTQERRSNQNKCANGPD